MLANTAADALVLVHLTFIGFVVMGALLVVRWKWIAWVHVPAVLWGAFVEFSGTICPLTPFEQSLRIAAGEQGYTGGFIDHYVVPVIYPAGLTSSLQVVLGVVIVVVNAAIYGSIWQRRKRGS